MDKEEFYKKYIKGKLKPSVQIERENDKATMTIIGVEYDGQVYKNLNELGEMLRSMEDDVI